MSTIRLFSTWLRSLITAVLAPRPTASGSGSAFVDDGESHYAASRERTRVRALYDGMLRAQ
jgi:hypothetical protein